jgi:hypothetical protein
LRQAVKSFVGLIDTPALYFFAMPWPLEQLLKEWDVIKQAPLTFILAFILLLVLAYVFMRWLYQDNLARKDELIASLKERLGLEPADKAKPKPAEVGAQPAKTAKSEVQPEPQQALSETEIRRSIYLDPMAMFHKLQEERRIYFAVTAFNGLSERITFSEEADGFILLDGKPLETRPMYSAQQRKYPHDRQTAISLTQEFSEDEIKKLNDRIGRGEKLTFDFREVYIYIRVGGNKYRLKLPEGLTCQGGIQYNITTFGKLTLTTGTSTPPPSVEYLNTLLHEGKWLLRQAVDGRTPNLTEQVKEWENRVGRYLAAFLGKDEQARFLNDEDIEVYTPPEDYSRAAGRHRPKQHFLDRVHTRVVRLEHIIEGLD